MHAPLPEPIPVPASEVPAGIMAAFDLCGWRFIVDAEGVVTYPAPGTVQSVRLSEAIVDLLDPLPAPFLPYSEAA